MADVGQEEDFAAAEKKAYSIGAKKFFLVVSSPRLSLLDSTCWTRVWSAYPGLSSRLGATTCRGKAS